MEVTSGPQVKGRADSVLWLQLGHGRNSHIKSAKVRSNLQDLAPRR